MLHNLTSRKIVLHLIMLLPLSVLLVCTLLGWKMNPFVLPLVIFGSAIARQVFVRSLKQRDDLSDRDEIA